MSERVRQIASRWAARHEAAFEWRADEEIWFLSTRAINESEDAIRIRPTAQGCELEKISCTGHVEIAQLTAAGLEAELEGILDWFGNRKLYSMYGHGHEK